MIQRLLLRGRGRSADKQNALRRECTFEIEIVLEIGVAGVNIYLKIPVLTLEDVLARLAQSVRPWQMVIDFLPMSRRVTRSNPINDIFFSFWPCNLHEIIVIWIPCI